MPKGTQRGQRGHKGDIKGTFGTRFEHLWDKGIYCDIGQGTVDGIVAVSSLIQLTPKIRVSWYKMKIREEDENEVELSTICRQLKLKATDGKMR